MYITQQRCILPVQKEASVNFRLNLINDMVTLKDMKANEELFACSLHYVSEIYVTYTNDNHKTIQLGTNIHMKDRMRCRYTIK